MLQFLASFAVNVVIAFAINKWLERRSACPCTACRTHRRLKAAGVNWREVEVVEPQALDRARPVMRERPWLSGQGVH